MNRAAEDIAERGCGQVIEDSRWCLHLRNQLAMDSTRHQPYLPCLRRHLNILQSAIAPIAARLAESPHDSAQTAANSWTDMSANAVYRASATSLDCATPHASLQPDDILRDGSGFWAFLAWHPASVIARYLHRIIRMAEFQ